MPKMSTFRYKETNSGESSGNHEGCSYGVVIAVSLFFSVPCTLLPAPPVFP